MAEIGSAYVSILPSARGFGRRLDADVSPEVTRSGVGLGKTFGKAFAVAGAAVIGLQIGSFLRGSISAASDLQQSIGGVEAVFGKYARSVEADSKKAAQAVGLSRNAYNELITVTGALLKNKGIKTFAADSKKIVTTGADLAATFGGTTKDAVEALNAALRGENDPIERYGISLNESAVKAVLAAKGQDKLKGAALDQAKAQARLQLIAKQSADAQGKFASESDTLAGQQQRLGAQWEDFKATIGTALLPVLTKFFGFLNKEALPAIKDLGKVFKSADLSKFFSALGGGSGEAGEKFRSFMDTLRSVWTDIKAIFSSATAIVLSLWRIFGASLTASAKRAFSAMLNTVRGAFTVLRGIFQLVAAILKGDWSGAWDAIKTIARGGLTLLKGLFQTGMNAVRTVFSLALDALGALMATAWDGIKSAASAGISGLIGLLTGLPGKILSAVGDLSKLLYNAGIDLLQGFLDGISSKVGEIKDKLGDLTGKLTDWKGPPKRDRVILRPAGRLVMAGFVDGLTDGAESVRRNLQGVTSGLAVAGPNLAGVAGSAGPSALANSRLRLVVGGREFDAYVEEVADSRVDAASGQYGMIERAL